MDGGDPEVVEFGIPVVDERLQEAGVTFPVTAEELEAVLGETDIPYDAAGRTVKLSTALGEVDADRFDSDHELLDALHPVFEGYRERTASGVIGALRGLLPF